MKSILIRIDNRCRRINRHPYYLALFSRDSKYFESYVATCSSYQRKKKSSTWKGYINLMRKIRHYGYRPIDPIILKRAKNGDWCCHHGRHRMCILYYLYGPNAILKTKKIDSKKRQIIAVLK